LRYRWRATKVARRLNPAGNLQRYLFYIMATDKKAIVFYVDWIHVFEALDDNEAGKLVKHLLRYVNDQNPEPPDKLTKIAFEPIKQQLKRDLVKWEGVKEIKSIAGHAGGIKSGEARRKQKEANEACASNPKQNEANEAVTDTVTVIESVIQPTHAILESNLNRKPKIPTKDKVWEVFMNHGGTKEMAKKFFDTYEASGWFNKNGPITNFANLVPGYVQSWKEIKNKDNGQQSGPTLRIANND